MLHRPAIRDEVVANEPAVAPPEHAFRTHNRGSIGTRKLGEFFEPATKVIRQHVVGISAKTFVSPARQPSFGDSPS